MKKHHGSFSIILTMVKFLLMLWSITIVYAEDFTSKFTLSNTTPYVKEAVIMKLDLVQTDHSKVILFKFSPKKSDEYEFYRLDIKEEDAYHSAKVHYTYLIYPLRSGEISITFDLIEMVTTDEKIAYSFSGDRDNVRGLNKVDIPITLPALKLQARTLPKETEIVGDFTIQHTIKKDQADAFEPLALTITLKGTGYPPILENIIPSDQHYRLFNEKAILQLHRSSKGTKNSVTYPYAFSAKKSFDLPKVTIHAFNPKTQNSYLLTLPKKHFTITQSDPKRLLDKIDSPKALQISWSWLYSILSYLLVFAIGFLTAKLLKWNHFNWKKSSKNSSNNPLMETFTEEIKATNDPKVLLALLIATDARRYSDSIKRLEEGLYGKKRYDLKRIKREIVETL